MHIRKLWLSYFILIVLVSPVLTMSVFSDDHSPPIWRKDWKYQQEIMLPISTDDPHSIFQPIDILIEFDNPCWAKNEKEHSIRIVCWDGSRWHELESQIYDLEFKDSYHITSCVVVFLIPEIASGEERYFIYYDNEEKSSPNYPDHVGIEDDYYYWEPISGIAAEGDYYKITEDEYVVYGIGQKGKIMNRWLSQAVIKMKPESKSFSVSNSDNIASFAFTYNIGSEDIDQASSDQRLVSKEIRFDGNLMVEFGLVSESEDKHLRTTNIYKYYYCPTKNKRIIVHVKHDVFEEGIVKGQTNLDGLYGALFSYQSKSARLKKMCFGEILPYIHVFGEDNTIKEYNVNTDPENKEREWIIPYSDDCDLGKDAWISYDEGESGRAFGLLLSSNEDIVKYGKDERDGIQVKSAQKEYLNVLGAEIDYATVIFGRNSYEAGGSHDLTIADDLSVEFDVEIFASEEGGYKEVIAEAEYFQTLAKCRGCGGLPPGEENIYTLTVSPRFAGRFLSFPIFGDISGFTLSKLTGELYQNGELVTTGQLFKPILRAPILKFTKLVKGDYVVKIYREILNRDKILIAIFPIIIDNDKFVLILCTWQKNIKITARDQNNERIENLNLYLYYNNTVILSNVTTQNEDTIMKVSYNLFRPYNLKAYYKGFIIHDAEIPLLKKEIKVNLDLYDITIDTKDKLGFVPGVNIRPTLTSPKMEEQIDLTPQDLGNGKYLFDNLPASEYTLQISYARFSGKMDINVPEDGESHEIEFPAEFDLTNDILDSRGSPINNEKLTIDIKRDGILLFESISPDISITLPPASYTVNVYSDGKLVGSKTVELTNDKNIKIVTKIEPLLPIMITGIIIVFIIELAVLIFIKKISLNTFLKLLALSLVILSLFQPWWALTGASESSQAEKNSEMYIFQQTMIETTTYNDKEHLELATLPEMFTDFLGNLLLIIFIGIFLLAASFIPNLLLKRRFFLVLISASILFITIVALAFSFGMSKITELSLGSLNGEATLDVALPNGELVFMDSTWGLGVGFYLCVISALILIFAGVIDYLTKKQLLKNFFQKND